jgi:hypothetical protein
MKKLVNVGLVAATVLLLGACGSKTESKDSAESTETSAVEVSTEDTEKDSDSAVVDKFADMKETGDGTLNIGSQSGDTAEGSEVIVYYDPNTFPTDVSVTTEGINGGLLSYVYADGQLLDSEQLSDSMTSFELQDVPSAITEGVHTFQLVQYENDDENGTVVTYKTQPYTIRLK